MKTKILLIYKERSIVLYFIIKQNQITKEERNKKFQQQNLIKFNALDFRKTRTEVNNIEPNVVITYFNIPVNKYIFVDLRSAYIYKTTKQ